MNTTPDLLMTVLRSLWGPDERRRWAVVLALVVVAVLGALAVRGQDAVAHESSEYEERTAPSVDRLMERAQRAAVLWREVESYYEGEVAPIARVLMSYRDDVALTRRIALALVSEARRLGLEPRLLLAVLLVENPWLDPVIRSPVGAVGLMQVMPQHRGNWPPCEPDLEDVEANICHGARIFAHYFRESNGDVERALLRYNGCVRGTNTPDCHRYPYHVYARAGRASVLAWLRPNLAEGAGASSQPIGAQ